MKKVHISVFFIVFVLVAAFSVLAVLGVYTTYGEITTTVIKGYKELVPDKAIGANATIVLKADKALDAAQLARAKNIVERRLDEYGYTNYQVHVDAAQSKLQIELTWVVNASSTLHSLATELAKQGLFEVREGSETDDDGKMTGVTLENCIISSDNIRALDMDYSSSVIFGTPTYSAHLYISLDKQGKQAVADETTRLLAENSVSKISFWLDGENIGSKSLSEAIVDGELVINDTTSSAYANTLSRYILLDCGTMPAVFTSEYSYEFIPTDGHTFALSIALAAALLVLCALFIVFFKLPGVCAAIALLFQAGASVAVFTGLFTDLSKTMFSFSSMLAAFAGLIVSAFAYALICGRVSRLVVDGNAAKRSVLTVFGAKGSKPLLSYVVLFVCSLAAFLLSAVKLFDGTAVYSYLGYIRSFSLLMMLFTAISLFAMLLFRLMLKALSGSTSTPDGMFCALFTGKAKAVSGEKRKGAVIVVACVCVAAVVFAALAVVIGPSYSFENNGGFTLVRSFTNEDIKSSELANKLSALSDKLTVQYGYVNSATAYALKVVVPDGVEVTSEQIVAVCDEMYPEAFKTLADSSVAGLYDAALLVRAAVSVLIIFLVAGVFVALFSARVKKLAAFTSVAFGGLVVCVLCVGVMIVCGVPLTDMLVTGVFACALVSVFVSSQCLFAVDSDNALVKQEAVNLTAAGFLAGQLSTVVSLAIVLALFGAAFIVVGLYVGVASIWSFGICVAVCGVVASVASGLTAVATQTK